MQGLSWYLAAHSLGPRRQAGSRRSSLTSGHSWSLRRSSGVGQVTPRMRGWQHCRCALDRTLHALRRIFGGPACQLAARCRASMADKKNLLAPRGPHQLLCISEVGPATACLSKPAYGFFPIADCAVDTCPETLALPLGTWSSRAKSSPGYLPACHSCSLCICHCTCPLQGGAGRGAGADGFNSHLLRLCFPSHQPAPAGLPAGSSRLQGTWRHMPYPGAWRQPC